jgi:O-antigen/teichoic acid export membrane protein
MNAARAGHESRQTKRPRPETGVDALLRIIGYLASAQALNAFLGLVYWAVAARLLALGDLGRASATLAVLAFGSNTSNVGFGVALIRFRHQDGWDYPRLAGSAVMLATMIAIVLSIALGVLTHGDGASGLVLVPWALVPATITTVTCNMLDALSMADRDGAGVALRNGVAAVGKLVLLVLVVRTGEALVLTTLASLVLSALIVWPRRRHSVQLSLSLPRVPRLFMGYALKQYAVTWLTFMPIFLFPVLALQLLGAAAAGYVALASGGALLLFSVGDVVGISLLVEGSRDRALPASSPRRAMLVVGPTLAAAVAASVVAAPLLSLVYGQRFDANAVALFRLMAVASLPYLLVASTIGRLRALDESLCAVLLAGLSGLGACVCLVILAPMTGLMAPGWAYLLADATAAVVAVSMLYAFRHRSYDLVRSP